MSPSNLKTDSNKIRIDKWLWAARFFKTRSLASDAVECGKVLLNEARVKPAKSVALGDMLSIRLGPYQFVVELLQLSDKRGGAPQAQKMYSETAASRMRREVVAIELKASATTLTGRPTKKDRRDLDKIKTGVW
ncbi:MAG: RNA-binding S4 domain-containing protein [Candidatus Nitrotoga sp.]